MGFNFGITFSPRNIFGRSKLLEEDVRKLADTTAKKIRRNMVHEMMKAAPGPAMAGPLGSLPLKYGPSVNASKAAQSPRSGKLRRGIKPVKFAKSGGKLDRTHEIVVKSMSPHTKYVVKGVKSRHGEGAKGKGRYHPAIGKRMRFGKYPGFKAYDFVSLAGRRVNKKLKGITDDQIKTIRRNLRRRLTR